MLGSSDKTITVCQGELAVSGDPHMMLSAVLGSCIATCLWDPVTRSGGMNHILLPGRRNRDDSGNKYGIFAMEALINELMKTGAAKTNLVAKIFGGAQTFDNGMRIGESNARFVRHFLEVESIPILAESVGGQSARRVRFFPESGRAKQLLTVDPVVSPDKATQQQQPMAASAALPAKNSGEVELF